MLLAVPSVTLAGPPASPAGALVVERDADLDPGAEVSVAVELRDGVGRIDPNSGSRTPWLRWTVTGLPAAGVPDADCGGRDPDDPLRPFGAWRWYTGYDPDTGAIVVEATRRCLPTDAPPPAAPPDFPTIEDAWNSVRLRAPRVERDPPARGITGLETQVWTGEAAPVSIDANVSGYSATGTATVVGYTVRVDDGPTYVLPAAGDRAAPLLRRVFETKGAHRITVGVRWHGVATFTGPDLASARTADIGVAHLTTTITYPVHEVRAVLLR